MEIEEENVVEPTTPSMLKAERACLGVTAESTVGSIDSSQQLQSVMAAVARDLTAADLKWSLFVAACQSYKQDSCLRPFPPMFLKDGSKDFIALAEAVEAVPAFAQLESQTQTLPGAAVDLLHWVLVDLKEPSLSVVDKSELDSVLGLVSSELSAPSPSLVVRLSHEASSATEQRWAAARHEHGSVYAFHGSRVVNFHSILHHGLQQHLTKNALFGQGVYLSSELLVCLPYSRNGFGWSHSVVGSELSVVALCEVVDHPTICCQPQGEGDKSGRARASDSMAGEVPHKLYLVPNSDLLRVRYLLVYRAQTTPPQQQGLTPSSSRLSVWLGQHKMAAALVAYAVMLAGIGLTRSPTVIRLWREFCRKIGAPY